MQHSLFVVGARTSYSCCSTRRLFANAFDGDGDVVVIPQDTTSASLVFFFFFLTLRPTFVSLACSQMENLRESLAIARADGVEVRGIAVINPGNPTGNILAADQIKDIIEVIIVSLGTVLIAVMAITSDDRQS